MKQFAKITRIDEPDFGCEGRPDQEPVKDRLFLELEDGQQVTAEIEEFVLWNLGWDEGMIVGWEDGRILGRGEEQ